MIWVRYKVCSLRMNESPPLLLPRMNAFVLDMMRVHFRRRVEDAATRAWFF